MKGMRYERLENETKMTFNRIYILTVSKQLFAMCIFYKINIVIFKGRRKQKDAFIMCKNKNEEIKILQVYEGRHKQKYAYNVQE